MLTSPSSVGMCPFLVYIIDHPSTITQRDREISKAGETAIELVAADHDVDVDNRKSLTSFLLYTCNAEVCLRVRVMWEFIVSQFSPTQK